MKRILKTTFALAMGLALGTTGAAAQVPGIGLDVIPKIGLYAPLSDLPTTPTAADVPSLDATLTYGAAAELKLPMVPFDLRASGEMTSGSKLSATGIDDTSEQTLLALYGTLVFRPLPKMVILQPYLMGGVGYKKYSYDVTGVNAADFQDTSQLAYQAGLGIDLFLGPLNLVVELNDYISQYEFDTGESQLQHDLFASAGLRFGIM